MRDVWLGVIALCVCLLAFKVVVMAGPASDGEPPCAGTAIDGHIGAVRVHFCVRKVQ